MDIAQKIAEIDAEIERRASPNFCIRFGTELYRALVEERKIKKAKFSILGTGAFEIEMPAYDGRYAAWNDWEIDEEGFAVGNPTD